MSKRSQAREKSKVDTYIEDVIHKRAEKFVGAIIGGYEKRLNDYLNSKSAEFKNEEVSYDSIKLKLESMWVEPSDQERMNIEKLRNIQLNSKAKIFKIKLRRHHYLNNEQVSSYQVWGSTGIQTPDIPTKKSVETITQESLVGYLAEKGIEYIEAERSTYRQFNPEQPSQEVEEGVSAQ